MVVNKKGPTSGEYRQVRPLAKNGNLTSRPGLPGFPCPHMGSLHTTSYQPHAFSCTLSKVHCKSGVAFFRTIEPCCLLWYRCHNKETSSIIQRNTRIRKRDYTNFLYGDPLFKKVRKIFNGQGHQSTPKDLKITWVGRIAQPVEIFDLGKIYPNRWTICHW